MRTLTLAALLVTAAAAPLAAQTTTTTTTTQTTPDMSAADRPTTPLPYDLGHDNNNARSNAIAAASSAGVADANAQTGAQAAAQGGSAVNQPQYDADMAAYREALRQRHHAINRDAAIYDHQQRAYADAMADWRLQVAACERGHHRACKLPTPDPANYW